MAKVGQIVHYFSKEWHHHPDSGKHANCIAAIITREPHLLSSGETEPLSSLVVFDKGIKFLVLPHHKDFKTHEYHDYDSGSWHTTEECDGL